MGSPRHIRPGQKIHSSCIPQSRNKNKSDIEGGKNPYIPKAVPPNCTDREKAREFWGKLDETGIVEVDLYDEIQHRISAWLENIDYNQDEELIKDISGMIFLCKILGGTDL